MRELSIFVDESGSDGLSDHHYGLKDKLCVFYPGFSLW